MRIAVTGSIATDHLMSYSGRFADQLLPDQLANVSLSFLVEDLDIRRGGVAANICFGMGVLGLRPLLVGSVGRDFDDYRSWLERHGVETHYVRVSELKHTARFLCTTDTDQNQIASFYPGAMSEAREIELGPLGPLDLVVVSPNDPQAMLRHTRECRDRGVPFVADPSQQLSSLDGEQVRELVEGAELLLTNEYEAALTEKKTGWSPDELLGKVGVRVTTQGAKGAVVERRGEMPIHVPVPPEERKADPTGVGDAFRAGFLSARSWGLGYERCAQVGSLLATYCLETVGTQEYDVTPPAFLQRMAKAYGDDAAAEVGAHLGV
ncbi:MAG: adenosine kinase [Frankiaceae bacterium]|jgi:adenosine kinase|nr:adenosine kinase [Frankiaceae bacterium]MDX6226558.1 adenosine kinase [Frankiales bacterium]